MTAVKQYFQAFTLSVLTLSTLFFFFKMYTDNEMSNIPKIWVKEAGIQTGDLILFRYSDTELTFRMISKYTHVGMVLKTSKGLYVIECHPNTVCECKNNGGVHVYPLDKKIKTYDGSLYFCKMDLTSAQRRQVKKVILKNLESYKKKKFELYISTMLLSAVLHKKYPISIKNMYCSQFIMQIYKDARIFKNTTVLPIVPDIFLRYSLGDLAQLVG